MEYIWNKFQCWKAWYVKYDVKQKDGSLCSLDATTSLLIIESVTWLINNSSVQQII